MRARGSLLILLTTIALAGCGVLAISGGTIAQSDLARDTTPVVSEADSQALLTGNSQFAFDFYRQVRGQEGNLVFSPYSISLAAAMLHPGANDETASQIAKALDYTLPASQLHPAFNALQLSLAQRPDEAKKADRDAKMELDIANAVWTQKDYAFEQPYLDLLAVNYGAGIHLVDFINEPGDAAQQVNHWVDEQTRGKIKDIISPDSMDPSTRMILANAVYFKANWQDAFVKKLTADAPFTLLDDSQVQVPTMQTDGAVPVRFASDDGYQAVALPYKGALAEMILLMPDEGNFETFEAGLDAAAFSSILTALRPSSVPLYMPKFEFTSDFDLKEILFTMGMTLAFDDQNADFSNITKEEELYIGQALHKAYVLVNEEGTEAAAVTAFQMMAASLPPSELRIDRPFIFVIRDVPTGTILFAGRVLNPVQS